VKSGGGRSWPGLLPAREVDAVCRAGQASRLVRSGANAGGEATTRAGVGLDKRAITVSMIWDGMSVSGWEAGEQSVSSRRWFGPVPAPSHCR
jgi:hypothetical protein